MNCVMKNAADSAARFKKRRDKSGRYSLTLIIALGLPLPVLAQTPDQVDRLTEQWLSIESQTSHLQSSWETQQPVLKQRMDLLQAEKKQLQALMKQSGSSEDNVDSRRAELLDEQNQLEQQQAALTRSLAQLASKLEEIAPLLPPVLAMTWQDEQNTLDSAPATSQQLQVALAQLSALAEFEQRISVHEGVVSNDAGQEILVKQLYLGAGFAWFTSRDAQQVGWGRASDDGWSWHFDTNIDAEKITKAIDIFEKRATAELVHLPIQLSKLNATPHDKTTGEQQQ